MTSQVADETAPTDSDGRLGVVLLVVALSVAALIHTGGFRIAEIFWGDLAYHRGVAYTMSPENINGEGPFAGLPSYYGGLFPLGVGGLSAALGVSFDSALSVLSWFGAVLVPVAYFVLGRRLWPGDLDRAGSCALVATVATGVSGKIAHGWANGVLPASANEWPLYPRDLAVVLVVLALAACVQPHRGVPGRAAATAGSVAGLGITVHLQLGLYGGLVVVAWILHDARGRQRIVSAALAMASGAVVSAWWWLPRIIWTVKHGPLELGSRPGIAPSLSDIVLSVGWMFVLLPVAIATRRRGDSRARFLIGWMVALAPLIVLSAAVPDAGVITQRRVLFFAGIPAAVFASGAFVAIGRRSRPLLAVLVLAMTVTATRESLAALRFVDEQWQIDEYGFVNFPEDGWSSTLTELRSRVRSSDGSIVLTGDADGLYLWSQTGAQPYSAWLPGFVKTGFDLESFTGAGVGTRVRTLDDAFRNGMPGLCALAERVDADAMVLRTDGDGIATHDLRPSGEFRPAAPPTDVADLRSRVSAGTVYRARQRQETLLLSPGTDLDIALAGSDATALEIHAIARDGEQVGNADLIVDGETGTTASVERGRSVIYRFDDVNLAGADQITFVADDLLDVVRVLGFEQLPDLELAVDRPLVRDGSVLLDVAATCRSSVVEEEDGSP